MSLPIDLRDIIRDFLAGEGNLTPLMRTYRQLHSEVLSQMPGGRLIDYVRAQDNEDLRKLQESIEAQTLNIIAEPWYSSGSVLKFKTTWRERHGDPRR
jgi:hypothetical protein